MTAELVPAAPRASMPDKVAYAQELANSGLLPASYRKQPANILYSIEYGEMLGLAPLAAITGVHVIEGKPTASSALISALVRRAGHRLRVSGDDKRAVAEIVRSDDPDFTFRSEWTMERARTADLTKKGVWKSYPAAMLKARAITEVARDACEEALLGMHYTPEELGAEVDEDGVPVRTATVTPLRGGPDVSAGVPTQSNTQRAAADEPDWDARIAECERGRDRTGLVELWKQARAARPDDTGLHARITEAGGRVKAAAQAEQDAEPVDAEVVDEEMTADEKRRHALMFQLLAETDVAGDQARTLQLLAMISDRPDLADPGDLSHDERGVIVAWLDSAKQAGEIGQAFTLAQEEAAEAARDDDEAEK